MSEIRKPIYVLDGSFSSQISKYDKTFTGHPLWCSVYLHTNPELVFETHLDYLNAGADIITTNTYQASVPGFQKHLEGNLSEQQCVELIERAVKIAKEARDFYEKYRKDNNLPPKQILIAGSVGPYGACLNDASEYSGHYIGHVPMDEIKKWHKPRIEALIRSGVDLLALETIPAVKEAKMLVELIKHYPETKAWLTFSCKDAEHTSFGDNFHDAAIKCYDCNKHQLVAVGANCTKPAYIETLFKSINDHRKEKIPLIAYPNSGETYDADKGWIDGDKCKPIESFVPTWINMGVQYIGGCCRTTDDTISNIRAEVDKILHPEEPPAHTDD